MSDRAPVCIGGLYRFLDEMTGTYVEVPVSADLQTAIVLFDLGLAAREKARRRREATQGPGWDPIDWRETTRTPGNPPAVLLLLGLDDRWDGPRCPRPCPSCGGPTVTLPAFACCLRCDR
jgi:hypothetical protein